MMRKPFAALGASVIVAALAPGFQATAADQVVIPRGGTVQIAVVLPFTGFNAGLGEGAWNAVQLAVEKHSRIAVCDGRNRGPEDTQRLRCHGKPRDDRSGVAAAVGASFTGLEEEDGQGFVVQLNPFNGPCGPDAGQNVLAASQVVANPQNVAVIGHFCSAGFSAALPVYQAAGVATLSGSATGSLLPSFGPDVFNSVAISDACCPFQDNFGPWYNAVSQLPNDLFWRQHVYQREFGTPPPAFADLYYDAASLLLDKIASIASLTDDGSLVIDRAALAQAVRTTDGFDGVTCDVTLSSNGFRVNDPVSLAKCAGGGAGEDLD
jgi:ABC-type branched-subunit amino acid transport system substrate-binding protein